MSESPNSNSNANANLLTALVGAGGTGKTYQIIKRMAENTDKRPYAILAATTGIAAINLSGNNNQVSTVNSLLGYYDTASLQDNYVSGKLHNKLKPLAGTAQRIVIDEMSMMSAEQGEIITQAVLEVNQLNTVIDKGGLGVMFAGDFCQLPPVSASDKFLFQAASWDRYEVEKLTSLHRQSHPEYMEALQACRIGDGERCAEVLEGIPEIRWGETVNSDFQGTTLFALNKKVDRMNNLRLGELVEAGKKVFKYATVRWGKQKSEWERVPEEVVVTEGSYVQVLSNDAPSFNYCNGDCGTVTIHSSSRPCVTLERNKVTMFVKMVVRKHTSKFVPEGKSTPEVQSKKLYREYMGRKGEDGGSGEIDSKYEEYLRKITAESRQAANVDGKQDSYYDALEGKWVIGEIRYAPIKLAYATTVHKSQGLTLDRVQIDITDGFFGQPCMAYVALSRTRAPEGLRIVGNPMLLEHRVNTYAEVLPWA